MLNVGISFEMQPNGDKALPGWSKVNGHLVFNLKMDCTRKERCVLDGHKTPDPVGSAYAGVVSMESVMISFTSTGLNGLDVFADNIRNAYLQAPFSKKTSSYVVKNLVWKTWGKWC